MNPENELTITAGEARDLFTFLQGQSLARARGLCEGGCRTDAFDQDLFIISDKADFRGLPLPHHIRFDNEEAVICQCHRLPKTIQAKVLTIGPQTSGLACRLDASKIETITCSTLFLDDPSHFPRAVQAEDIQVKYSDEAWDVGPPDLSHCSIVLSNREVGIHVNLLGLIGALPLANLVGFKCLIGDLHLHEWARQPSTQDLMEYLHSSEREGIRRAATKYETVYNAKARLEQPETPQWGTTDLELI